MGKDWDSPGGTGDFPMRRTTEAHTVNTGVTRQGGRQRSCDDFAKRQARDARSFQAWSEAWATVAFDVLKPGGHLLAFGGTRTSHRLACALEDAGFEIRDCLMWLYGSGFPKSLDVSKAIDKAAGAERTDRVTSGPGDNRVFSPSVTVHDEGTPVTPDAVQWHGWGTALKPAWEQIILARRPLSGTVAANVLEHGTGALNIDACRIGTEGGTHGTDYAKTGLLGIGGKATIEAIDAGRWPANVVLDETASHLLDQQSGERQAGANPPKTSLGYGSTATGNGQAERVQLDGGGASRFFYTAKASRSERNDGIQGRTVPTHRYGPGLGEGHDPDAPALDRNHHPTVKPVSLMRWLVRLACPPGGTVLDPFVGSGSTLVACRAEMVRGIGIDREADYLKIAAGRLSQLSLFAGDA